MSQYIFILVWIAAMFFLKSVMSGGYRVENILGKKEYRVSWGFAAFAFCPVVIMATFRGDMKFCDDVFEKPYFKQDTNMPLDKLEKNSLEYQVDHDLWIACAWNKVIKRELFYQGKLYFNLGITSEDIDWCLRLALYAEKFDFIANVIVCYRQRKTSISNSITVQKMDMLIDNIEVCLSLLEKEQKIRKIDILKPYIGYQYGTAIYSMSFITNKKEYNRIMKRLNQNKDVLRWSKNRKVQMLQLVDYIGGNKLLVFLLRIKNRLNKLQ